MREPVHAVLKQGGCASPKIPPRFAYLASSPCSLCSPLIQPPRLTTPCTSFYHQFENYALCDSRVTVSALLVQVADSDPSAAGFCWEPGRQGGASLHTTTDVRFVTTTGDSTISDLRSTV